jgi:SAM-dependent MidA family methyltransferase
MADEVSPLADEIRRLIAVAGPMPVAEYMRLCLTHPEHGYYTTRDPFGAKGDFITAPEVSQMFGELIGLWMAAVWQEIGTPSNVRIIELGPGRGTLMQDAMRAAKVVSGFRDAIVLHLVEISPALRAIQQQRLQHLEMPMFWHETLGDVPPGVSIIVANEFVDALPVSQAVKLSGGWHERVVEVGPKGRFAITAKPEPLPFFAATMPLSLRQAPEGSIYEWRADDFGLELGRRMRSGGASLIIDYGHAQPALGDTLQAVAGHAFTDPLQSAGNADLTAHVDFTALGQCAETMGARRHGPVPQRDFLFRLGIETRAATLKASAPAEKRDAIDAALARLTAGGARGMGDMFKAMAIAAPTIATLPGFPVPS